MKRKRCEPVDVGLLSREITDTIAAIRAARGEKPVRRVEPKVFLIGESRMDFAQLDAYLEHIGTSWRPPYGKEATLSHGETLVEVYGRLCYRSWEPGMNRNVTKIRAGQVEYIGNILKSGHGSVIEHPVSHWIFADVSRVFTHEFVRHRAGTAFSQESLRYVRLTDLGLWLPPEIEAEPEIAKLFEETFESLEKLQVRLAEAFKLDDEKSFARKKKVTSAMRRVAPIGLATTIGATLNMRALRHVLTMRSEGAAEAELQLVFGRVGEIATERWPSLFQDFERGPDGAWVPGFKKV